MKSATSDKATRPRRGIAIGLSSAVIAAIVLVGCSNAANSGSSAPSSGGAAVNVTLTEWAVVLDKSSVPAGNVSFHVTNAGTQFKHEFVVIKTDLAPDALPADSTGKVDEESSDLDFIGEVEELEIGASEDASFDLTAGKYVLICNIVEAAGGHESHYNQGMRVAFTVT